MSDIKIGDRVFIHDQDYYGQTGVVTNFIKNHFKQNLVCVKLDHDTSNSDFRAKCLSWQLEKI